MKLSINSIIRWEQITGRPFYSLDYSDKHDIVTLFYVCSALTTTFEDYKNNMTESEINSQIKDIEIQTIISSQFQKKVTTNVKNDSEDDSIADESPVFIKDIIPTLILEGLDANFALYEMDICDLPLFVDAFEKMRKERLETQRLWVWLTVSPHLTKKIEPKKLYPFPWEIKQIKADAARNMEQNKESLGKFLKGELFDINKFNWTKQN